jgi:hypothetical protein
MLIKINIKKGGPLRWCSSLPIHPCIQVKLKGTSTMLVVKVTERHPGRENYIMKHICACFLTGSLTENRADLERLFIKHC